MNKSFLGRAPTGRYEVHELLRQYAAEKLDEAPPDKDRTLELHCQYYVSFLCRKEIDIWSGYLEETLPEVDNIRAAWRQAILRRKASEIRRSGVTLWWLYETLGSYHEGVALLEEAIHTFRADAPAGEAGIALGLILGMQGICLERSGHAREGIQRAREGRAILQRLGAQREYAWCTMITVKIGGTESDAEAEQLLRQTYAIYKELRIARGLPFALNTLADLYMRQGAYGKAEPYCREALEICTDLGHRRGIAWSLLGLGKIAYAQRQYVQARQFYEESLVLFQEMRSALTIGNLYNFLGDVALAVGEYPEAGKRYRQAISTYEDIGVYWAKSLTGDRWGVARSLNELGEVALAIGDASQSREYHRQALEIAVAQHDLEWSLKVLVGLAAALARDGVEKQAVELAALVTCHPASTKEAKDKAQRLIDSLKAELPTNVLIAAQARGPAQDLESTVRVLLATPGR